MEKRYKHVKIVASFFILLMFIGCSDDNEVKDSLDSEHAVVGEWYVDYGIKIDGIKDLGVAEYFNNGTWSGVLGKVSKDGGYYVPMSGTYQLKDKKLIKKNEDNSIDTYDIKSAGKYDLLLYYNRGEIVELSHRIVDTYYLVVGDKKQIAINDPEFFTEECFSSDENIAGVSNLGEIQAHRHGTAYISVKGSLGTAVVRVVVSNPVTMVIDDFPSYLGENVSKGVEAYGNTYYDEHLKDNVVSRKYSLLDEGVEGFSFYYDSKSGIVKDILVYIRDSETMSTILDTFISIYQYKSHKTTGEENIFIFHTDKSMRDIAISVDLNSNLIYYCITEDPIAAFDKLAYIESASEVALKLGHIISEKEKERGKFNEVINSPIFLGCYVYFNDHDQITNFVLISKEGVDVEQLVSWYSQNYVEINKGSKYWNDLYSTLISISSSADGTLIMYTK